jgi:tetratricopeptide (TPR) repeat protein/transcriptional regulator with XRE-family HTH domain
VTADPRLSFAGLLRQLRSKAQLTQEELAEAAGVSLRSISDLERGIHTTAHKETARLLAAALGLDGLVTERFVAAARGRAPADHVLTAEPGTETGTFAAAAIRSLPRDTPSFTGRQAELTRVLGQVDRVAAGGGVVSIHAIDGMAGIGKTALAVHLAHLMAPSFPDGQFFVPLHAHTPGQRPVDPADALVSLLITAGLTPQLIPPGLEARAARWRDHVAGKKILLLLDDAASHEQVAPLLPGTAGILALVTSRRRLTALQDATVLSLNTLTPDESTTLLVRLAARPDMHAGDVAVSEITRLCGYLPLAIGMLAARLRHHPAWTPDRLAAGLAQGREPLAMMRAENLSVAAAFDLSYRDLTASQQRLFRRLGLAPGPDIDAYAAAALDGISLKQARKHLDDLYDQHLLTEPNPGRYQLHDLLREHAASLARTEDDEAQRLEAVHLVLDYYLHTAYSGSLLLNPVRRYVTPEPPCPGVITQPLRGLSDALDWFAAERQVLVAAIALAGELRFDRHAWQLAWAAWLYFDREGYWHEQIAIQRLAIQAAERLDDLDGQAHAYRDLGATYGRLDSLAEARGYCIRALHLHQELGDRLGEARTHNELMLLANRQDRPAEALDHAQLSLTLFRDEGYAPGIAKMLNSVGYLHAHLGNYEQALKYCQQSLDMYRDLTDPLNEAAAWDSIGYVFLNLGRHDEAITSLHTALSLIRKLPTGYYQTAMLIHLGDAYRTAGQLDQARQTWQQALKILENLKHPDADHVRARLRGQAPTARTPMSGGQASVVGRTAGSGRHLG